MWTPEELTEFLEAVKTDELYALWRLLAWTGVRRGEALRLRWEDLDARHHTVAIRRALCIAGNEQYLSAPKGAQSRVITLDAETVRVLRRHRGIQDRVRRTRKSRRVSAHDFVFADEGGMPVSPNRVSKRFVDLVRTTDLPEIRLHDLRDTHALAHDRSGSEHQGRAGAPRSLGCRGDTRPLLTSVAHNAAAGRAGASQILRFGG